jgi:hypothetical protein
VKGQVVDLQWIREPIWVADSVLLREIIGKMSVGSAETHPQNMTAGPPATNDVAKGAASPNAVDSHKRPRQRDFNCENLGRDLRTAMMAVVLGLGSVIGRNEWRQLSFSLSFIRW